MPSSIPRPIVSSGIPRPIVAGAVPKPIVEETTPRRLGLPLLPFEPAAAESLAQPQPTRIPTQLIGEGFNQPREDPLSHALTQTIQAMTKGLPERTSEKSLRGFAQNVVRDIGELPTIPIHIAQHPLEAARGLIEFPAEQARRLAFAIQPWAPGSREAQEQLFQAPVQPLLAAGMVRGGFRGLERLGQPRARARAGEPVAPEITKPELPKAEVSRETPRPIVEAAVKQPWEMTRKEFAIERRAESVELAKQTVKDFKDEELKALGIEAAETADFSRAHRNVVSNALKKGRPVPPEVLKDYPELVKKPIEAVIKPKDGKPKPIHKTPLNEYIAEATTREHIPYSEEFARKKHFEAVRTAKSRGKDIPPEVAKDYPDLAEPIDLGAGVNILEPFKQAKTWIKGILDRKRAEAEVAVPEVDPLIQKFTEEIIKASPIRSKQERLYTGERARRFAKSQAVGQKRGGEAGLFAELGQLKGELPTAKFKELRDKFPQEDIDALFNEINNSPQITYLESLNARKGLAKVFGEFGGGVPTKGELELLSRVFPEDFIRAIERGDAPSLFSKFKNAGIELINIPRSIMSSYDVSFPLRQGSFVGPAFRKEWFDSFKKQYSWFASEKSFKAVMDGIRERPNFHHMRGRVAFTELGKKLSLREEKFASSWAEKIPIVGIGVRASSRAYTAFANKLRADVFDSMYQSAENLGLKPARDPKMLDAMADFVNTGTGRGSLKRFESAALLLNGFFYSPRLMSSRLQLLNPLYYAKQPAFVRKQALRSLFEFAGTGMTILTMAKLGGLEVGADPRSADFGKIIIGNTRLDIWGGFQQYVRMAGQVISGELVSSSTGRLTTLGEGYRPLNRLDILIRQLESKEAPIASFASTLAKGKSFLGEELDIPKEIANRMIPMVVQDIYELAQENPKLLPLAILPLHGTGLQTYGVEGEPLTQKQKKNIFEMSKIQGARFEERENQRSDAEDLDEELQQLPAEEAIDRFKDLQKSNPQMAERLKGVIEDRNLGLNYEEKVLKSLGIENGDRARFIFKQLNEMETDAEKVPYLQDLAAKKIITDKVFQQLQFLIKRGQSQ